MLSPYSNNFIPEGRKPDLLDRAAQVAQVIAAVAAILAIFQDNVVWFVIFLSALVLFLIPTLLRSIKKLTMRKKEKEALGKFSNDFLSYLDRANAFVQGTNQYAIPYWVRNFTSRSSQQIKLISSNMDSFFAKIIENLSLRAKNGFKTYNEFDLAAREFYGIMDSFVLIYVDELIRELKLLKVVIQPHEMSLLKQKYIALSQFINEYNGFRSRISKFWNEEGSRMEIRMPVETLD